MQIRQTFYGDRQKCYDCYRPLSSCMCAYVTKVETNTKFVILMHPKEFKKVKNNTGHFTHLSLPNSELFIGVDFTDHTRINEIIATHESFVLFPSADALDLSKKNPKEQIPHAKNLAVFIIDSTWACTKKMMYESKNLAMLRHMSFQSERISQYQIKEQPAVNFLSTIESTHVVLEFLNTWHVECIPQERLDTFLNPFYQMVAYQKKLIENPLANSVRFKKRSST